MSAILRENAHSYLSGLSKGAMVFCLKKWLITFDESISREQLVESLSNEASHLKQSDFAAHYSGMTPAQLQKEIGLRGIGSGLKVSSTVINRHTHTQGEHPINGASALSPCLPFWDRTCIQLSQVNNTRCSYFC